MQYFEYEELVNKYLPVDACKYTYQVLSILDALKSSIPCDIFDVCRSAVCATSLVRHNIIKPEELHEKESNIEIFLTVSRMLEPAIWESVGDLKRSKEPVSWWVSFAYSLYYLKNNSELNLAEDDINMHIEDIGKLCESL